MPNLRTLLHRLLNDPEPIPVDPHFHRGPTGQPRVCDDPACAMPRLSL